MLGTPSLLLLVLGLRRDYASSKYDNWVKNISFRQLDETETQVLPYGLKHSITPRRIPIETIVSSVEAVVAHQRDLTESTKDEIRSRVASTVQSASIRDNNLTRDEQRHCYSTRR